MLDVTYGQTKNPVITNRLVDALETLDLEGTLEFGYPIFATADDSITADAMLVTLQHGLVALIFAEPVPNDSQDEEAWRSLESTQDRLFVTVENNLRQHDALRSGRQLAIQVQTVTLVDDADQTPNWVQGTYADVSTIVNTIRELPAMDGRYFRPLQAAIQRVTTIKPPKRRSRVNGPQSKGAIMKEIESEIANLDKWQRRAAIEIPDGPQRIRGLAGSGKTVVLALKAAYLHAKNPDWTIAVVFWTRSLYPMFEDLVRRFSFQQQNDEPDWNRLQILHAWGSRDREGFYRRVATRYDAVPRDFSYARSRYGMDGAFGGICAELLPVISITGKPPIYDAVLIDEAQDLPEPFFRMVYQMTRDPKRIVWAYDELQKLSEAAIPSVDDLFGVDQTGNPNVRLSDTERGPRQDIILPICYRNTPWALALAHGLGLGTSVTSGLVQSFDDPTLWTNIGYTLLDGDLTPGSEVVIARAPYSYPEYFPRLLRKTDAIQNKAFADEYEQARQIAIDIAHNLSEDELDHDDILIVLPNAYTARPEGEIIRSALSAVGLASHVVGINTTPDEMFIPGSIAIANIFRSKGNETPMVYVVNAQHCVSAREAATLRNILFTGITRAKAWVRIYGWGPGMSALNDEIDMIKAHDFQLRFKLPTLDELEKMRQIRRDRTAGEQARLAEAQNGLRLFLESLDNGDLSLDDLPLPLKTSIARHFGRGMTHDPDDLDA